MTTLKHKLSSINRKAKSFLSGIYHERELIVVFGEGDSEADIVLIGEAPGKEEELSRRPFVGKAGKNLDEFLRYLHMSRDKIYVTNVVKFRPTKRNQKTGRLSNRPPTREEIEVCRHILISEIETVRPRLVVTLGNTALRSVLDDKGVSIGDLHGKPVSASMGDATFVLFPLYHPASIIYNRSLSDTYQEDLDKLKDYYSRIDD